MYGMILNEIERKELEYLLKREMDELIHDLNNRYLEHIVKRSIQERYEILYQLFKRFASDSDCLRYLPSRYFSVSSKRK
ncbi:MAG: hypothetical protein H0Z32_13850 [Bacillaceae bacterium]|nr:hypothetical protein [Bacillaceae bacterium]